MFKRKKRSREPVLAVDPGLRAMGVAVLGPRGRLLHAGVLNSSADQPVAARVRQLRRELADLIARYRPRLLAIEATWKSRHPSVAASHRVAQACRRLARSRGIPVVALASGTVRRELVGDGRASKDLAARVVAAHLPELRPYLVRGRRGLSRHFGNLFDAVALALVARELSHTRRVLRAPRHPRR